MSGPSNINFNKVTPFNDPEEGEGKAEGISRPPPPSTRKEFKRVLEKKENAKQGNSETVDSKPKPHSSLRKNSPKEDLPEEDATLTSPSLEKPLQKRGRPLVSLAAGLPPLYHKPLDIQGEREAYPKRSLAKERQDPLPINAWEGAKNFQINPTAQAPEGARPSIPPAIKALVERLVDRLYIVQKEGRTDTVIEVKNIPLFEGARITVTSFTSAQKEFNLSFENLLPQAKALLDNNMNALTQHLKEQGFVSAIHIITTSAIIEAPPEKQEALLSGDREGSPDQGYPDEETP